MGDDKKAAVNHKQFMELQQLLKNLGITTKHIRLNEADKKRANEAFPD